MTEAEKQILHEAARIVNEDAGMIAATVEGGKVIASTVEVVGNRTKPKLEILEFVECCELVFEQKFEISGAVF